VLTGRAFQGSATLAPIRVTQKFRASIDSTGVIIVSSRPEKSSSIRRQLEKEAQMLASPGGAVDDFSSATLRQSPEDSSFRATDIFTSSSIRSGAAALLANEDKTVISKHTPGKDSPAPIPVGPLDCRTTLEGMTLDHFRLDVLIHA
jgi:hypothetical protein